MRNRRWYPNRPVRGNDPGAVAGAHGHNTTGRIYKLVPIVKMRWDDVPCGVVVRVSRNLGVAISRRIKNRLLALSRHSLSQYRKYVSQASTKLRAELEMEGGSREPVAPLVVRLRPMAKNYPAASAVGCFRRRARAQRP